MTKVTEAQRVKKMMDNLSAEDNQGLSYGVMEGYISGDTGDVEFDNAIKHARLHLETISSKLADFGNEVDSGKYDQYLD